MQKRSRFITAARGYLKFRRVSEATLSRYSRAVISFLETSRITVPDDLSSLSASDIPDQVVEYFLERLFESGYEVHVGTYLVAALNFFVGVSPRAQTPWPNARGALAGWKNLEPAVSRLPCPWIVAVLVASHLARMKTAVALQAARLWILSFDTYSRSCEVLDIKTHNCFIPGVGGSTVFGFTLSSSVDFENQALAGLPLRTKTKTSDDTVIIDSKSFSRIGDVFHALVSDAFAQRADTLSYRLDYPTYARLIADAATRGGVPYKVTPHLARHGGPSEDFFRKKRTLDEICKRGRWRDKRSVMRYEKSGMLLKSLSALSPQVRSECERVERSQLSFLM